MEPIVNGLEEEYGQQIEFVSLNAEDGDRGERAFAYYGLRGHPTIVIILPDGQVQWVGPGVLERDAIEQEILTILN